jgi:DNA-binding PadR family transcriptional regulator
MKTTSRLALGASGNGSAARGGHLLVGDFQLEVLQSVCALRSAAFGANVLRHLEHKLGREIHMPQVYAALTRLQGLGMISSFKDENSSAGRRGRTRRVYHIEAPGLRMLEAGELSRSALVGGLNENLKTSTTT